jgi:hypothetical protein
MIGGGDVNVMVSVCTVVFPAISAACTVMVLAPMFNVSGQLTDPPCGATATLLQVTVEIPDNPSETLPVTVTPAVATVAPFGGDTMLRVGGVLSMFNVTLVVTVFPALSVAVPKMI